MGISVIIGYTIGYYLDKWLGTKPILTIVWLGFGLVAAGRAVWDAYQKAKRIGEEDSSAQDQDEDSPKDNDEERPPEA
jgi:ATP synthase protein I